MKAFTRTIDMRSVDGSAVNSVTITRAATHLFWCKANKPGLSAALTDLGPIRLGLDQTLTPQFDLGQVGDEDAANAFLTAFAAHLINARIV